MPVIRITKTWTRAHFLRLEEEKLERLVKMRAPEPSLRWVKQQIAYLRSNKPYDLSRDFMIARVPGLVTSFAETNVHDMCVGLFREVEGCEPSPTLQGIERVPTYALCPEPVLEPEVECLLQETYHPSPWVERVFDPGGP